MPNANGIELTVLIRDQDAFLHTPIVFLSGESDEDRHFDALEAGGDDFLSKPMRPKHLIAAVKNRVTPPPRPGGSAPAPPRQGPRHRPVQPRGAAGIARMPCWPTPATAARRRAVPRNRKREPAARPPGPDRRSSSCCTRSARCWATPPSPTAVGRFGDGSYLVLDRERDEAGLEALATQLRGALVQHPFNVQGHPLRLRVSVGVCALRHRFDRCRRHCSTPSSAWRARRAPTTAGFSATSR